MSSPETKRVRLWVDFLETEYENRYDLGFVKGDVLNGSKIPSRRLYPNTSIEEVLHAVSSRSTFNKILINMIFGDLATWSRVVSYHGGSLTNEDNLETYFRVYNMECYYVDFNNPYTPLLDPAIILIVGRTTNRWLRDFFDSIPNESMVMRIIE